MPLLCWSQVSPQSGQLSVFCWVSRVHWVWSESIFLYFWQTIQVLHLCRDVDNILSLENLHFWKHSTTDRAVNVSAHSSIGQPAWQESGFRSGLRNWKWKGKSKYICFWPQQTFMDYLDAIRMKAEQEKSIWIMCMWIKCEAQFWISILNWPY